MEFMEGRYGHAIYSKEGGWPKKIESYLNKKSKAEGYSESRLPPFTDEEIKLIKGTSDFYALNHYTSSRVRRAAPGESIGAFPQYGSAELGVVMERDPAWDSGDQSWFGIYPEGLRKLLNYLNSTYGLSEILITENGFLSTNPSLNDTRTVNYTRKYLEQVVLARRDGVNVSGYIHWSLMDNYENGYRVKYGLYSVDFTDPNRTRTPRLSAQYYSNVTRTQCVHPAGYTTT